MIISDYTLYINYYYIHRSLYPKINPLPTQKIENRYKLQFYYVACSVSENKGN